MKKWKVIPLALTALIAMGCSDESTDNEGTSADTNGGSGTSNTDNNGTTPTAQYLWSESPATFNNYDAENAVRVIGNQVIQLWNQDSDLWASVVTEDEWAGAQTYNLSKSGGVGIASVFNRPDLPYEAHFSIAVNSKGEACVAWPEFRGGLDHSVKMSCFLSTSGVWSEPILLNTDISVNQPQFAKIAVLPNDKFAVTWIESSPIRRAVVTATPMEVENIVYIERENLGGDAAFSVTENSGVNLLVTDAKPDVSNGPEDLVLYQFDANLQYTEVIVDGTYTDKTPLALSSNSNPYVFFHKAGDDPKMVLLGPDFETNPLSEITVNVGYYPSMVVDGDNTVHLAWWNMTFAHNGVPGDEYIVHVAVSDGNAVVNRVAEVNSLSTPRPKLIGDTDELYLAWLLSTDGNLFLSHYKDGQWSEAYSPVCDKYVNCLNNPKDLVMDMTDDVIAISFNSGDGGKLITSTKVVE